MLLLEIERVVDDASREAEEGQKHEPCRCYAHRERVPKSCPAERPSVPAILAAETKEMLNARQSRFAAASDFAAETSAPFAGPSLESPGRQGRMIVAVVPCPSVLSSIEAAAMKLGKSAHDRKPEPGPVPGAAASIVGLHERIAELGQVLLGDADAVIGDAEFDVALGLARRDAH